MSQIVLSGRGVDIEYIEIANGLCDEIVRTGLSVAELCHLFAGSECVFGRLNDESRIEFEGQKLLDVAIEVTDDEPYSNEPIPTQFAIAVAFLYPPIEDGSIGESDE